MAFVDRWPLEKGTNTNVHVSLLTTGHLLTRMKYNDTTGCQNYNINTKYILLFFGIDRLIHYSGVFFAS